MFSHRCHARHFFPRSQKAVGLFQGEEHECRVVAYKVQSVKRVRQYHYRVHWRGRSQKLQSFVPETELQVWTEEKAAELQERAAQIQAAEEAKKAEAEEKKQLAREKKAARLSAKAAQIAAAAQHGDFGSEGGIMPSGGVAMRPVGAPPSSSKRKSKGDDIDLTGLRTVQTTKNHPPYHQLVKIAIHAIKDRNGSSLQAVSKYIINNYFVDEKKCRKATTVALKAGLAKNHIKKVKNSYKLTPAALNDLRAQKRKAEAAKKARENRRGSSDGSGGAAGGGGSRRRSIRFPCPDEWLDTEAHLAAGRPTVAIPDPFPHLAVPGAGVGDLFMVRSCLPASCPPAFACCLFVLRLTSDIPSVPRFSCFLRSIISRIGLGFLSPLRQAPAMCHSQFWARSASLRSDGRDARHDASRPLRDTARGAQPESFAHPLRTTRRWATSERRAKYGPQHARRALLLGPLPQLLHVAGTASTLRGSFRRGTAEIERDSPGRASVASQRGG